MFVQLPPDLLQSCHWCLKELGLPVQEPFEELNTLPSTGVPLIEGNAVLVGAAGGVGSVTGCLGSVTGCLGSVTGCLGSVTGGVGSTGVGGPKIDSPAVT